MKKQSLFLFLICLLLGAVSGCNKPAILPNTHPIPGVVIIDANGKPTSNSVWVDKKGILTFRSVTPGVPLTVDFSSPLLCDKQGTITKQSPFSCTVFDQDGNYTLTVTAPVPGPTGTTGTTPKATTPITAYVRSCNTCP